MRRSLVVAILSSCLVSCSSNGHQLQGKLKALVTPTPKTASLSVVGPIGRDPFSCMLAANVPFQSNAAAICTFNLPPVPVNYTVECTLVFSVNAASSGNMTVNVNPDTNAAASTTFFAWTPNPSTQTVDWNAVIVSTSGDQPVLQIPAAPTTAPSAFFLSGVWPAAGTAQTFEILIEGTSLTGNVLAGSFCRMHP